VKGWGKIHIMGFKEGFDQGYKVADKVHAISSEFADVHDPKLDLRLISAGVAKEDINRLAIRLTVSSTEIGYMLAGVTFMVKHGTIWNPKP